MTVQLRDERLDLSRSPYEFVSYNVGKQDYRFPIDGHLDERSTIASKRWIKTAAENRSVSIDPEWFHHTSTVRVYPEKIRRVS